MLSHLEFSWNCKESAVGTYYGRIISIISCWIIYCPQSTVAETNCSIFLTVSRFKNLKLSWPGGWFISPYKVTTAGTVNSKEISSLTYLFLWCSFQPLSCPAPSLSVFIHFIFPNFSLGLEFPTAWQPRFLCMLAIVKWKLYPNGFCKLTWAVHSSHLPHSVE